MLAQRRKQWPNIKPTLVQFLVLARVPNKHETLTQCCVNLGPASPAVALRSTNLGPASRACQMHWPSAASILGKHTTQHSMTMS